MVGLALLDFLVGRGGRLSASPGRPPTGLLGPLPLPRLTSSTRFFCGSFTLPARQQCDRALWMMNLLDLALGSLYSRGPRGQGSQQGRPGPGGAQLGPPAAHLPVYSGTEAGEEALLPSSQSRSRLPGRRLGDMRPDGDGALQGEGVGWRCSPCGCHCLCAAHGEGRARSPRQSGRYMRVVCAGDQALPSQPQAC